MKNRGKVLNYKNYCSLAVLFFLQRFVESGIFPTFTPEYDRGGCYSRRGVPLRHCSEPCILNGLILILTV